VPSAAARADLDEIKASGERAAALTRQLLAFSRKQTLSPKVLDLNGIVTDTERMLKRVIGENVVLNCRLCPELGPVKADRSQLEQVILNLAVNARDAMPEGGALTIETADRELDAAYCQSHPEAVPGRHALLAVTDTGTGMDARTRARIFEPFFTTKETGRGTGLGLSMVFGIVRQSGGHVDVLSEPGRGARFEIYLPVVAGEPEARKTAASPSPAGAGEGILLVEDEAPLRRMAARMLSSSGYSVLEAADAEGGLALFQERGSEIRLLLTDVILPGKTGRWLAERLREGMPALRVLYTSGYADGVISNDDTVVQGGNFLPKPFTAEGLLSAVRAALDA
jgi:CheY-like chemotaxis protein